MDDRLTRIRAALAEAKLDALYISSPVDDSYGRHSQNRQYVSGFSGSTGRALITRDRAILAVDFRYVEQAEREAVPLGFEVWKTSPSRQKEWLPRLFADAELAGTTIGISRDDVSYGEFVTVQEAARSMPPGARPKLKPAPRIVESLRKLKDAAELMALQRSIDICDAAYERTWATIAAGQTEREVAAEVESAIRALGGDGVAFDTIVAGGPWAAMPHASPRDEPLREGQTIVIDMGALAGGYCSDLTRTTVLGAPDGKFQEIYAIVFEAQRNAIERVEPGMTGPIAHALAWDVIAKHGYGEQFGHGLGHGVGLEVHEAPYLGKTSEDTLQEGMVFTIEPGIYVPGWGGVRIEDVVVLEGGRARVLSRAQKLTPAGVTG
jgi:Xaa-Pro aminopeptidase